MARVVASTRTATARACLLVLALSVASLMTVARVDGAGAPAPAPAADCTDALLSLAGCLSYVQEGSTVTTPDPTCCSGLKDVVRKDVACLCQAFKSSQDFGVALNVTKALQLPAACNVKTPPFSKCNISAPGMIGGAPAPAPASGAPFFGQPPPSGTPSASPAGTGSDVPTATPASAPSPSRSDGVSFQAPTQTLVAAAVIAATLVAYRVL